MPGAGYEVEHKIIVRENLSIVYITERMPMYEGIGLISEKHAVVLDIGTAYTKCGYAGAVPSLGWIWFGSVSLGWVGLGLVWFGWFGLLGLVGLVWFGLVGLVWLGLAWLAWFVSA